MLFLYGSVINEVQRWRRILSIRSLVQVTLSAAIIVLRHRYEETGIDQCTTGRDISRVPRLHSLDRSDDDLLSEMAFNTRSPAAGTALQVQPEEPRVRQGLRAAQVRSVKLDRSSQPDGVRGCAR